MKLYFLSRGDYSDYEVFAVFDEEHLEEARRIADLIDARVEEDRPVELNHFDCEEPPPGVEFYRVWMCRKGHVRQCSKGTTLDTLGKRWYESWRVNEWAGHPWELYVGLYAKSEEHAVKVTNEIRAQIIAGAKPNEGNL